VDVMIVVVGRERRLYYIVTRTVCLYLVVLLDTLLSRVLTQEKRERSLQILSCFPGSLL